jgi:hypothetical protein
MEETGDRGISPMLSGAPKEEAVRSRQVQIGSKRMELRMRGNKVVSSSTGIQPMADSSSLLASGDLPALRERLCTDGYLLLRGVLDRETALRARGMLLHHLAPKGVLEGACPKEGWVVHDGRVAKEHLDKGGWTVDAESGGMTNEREADEAIEGWKEVGNRCCVAFAVCCLLSALCSLLSALCSPLSALCSLISALCSLISALCPLLSALCSLPSALYSLLCVFKQTLPQCGDP